MSMSFSVRRGFSVGVSSICGVHGLGDVMCGGDGDGDGDGEDRWLVHMVRHGDGGKDGMSDGDGEK